MVSMELEVLAVYPTSVGNIYSIAFPEGFVPVAGHTFWAANRHWKVHGVAFSSGAAQAPGKEMRECVLMPREHQLDNGVHHAEFD
jgi:hypothetical protein